MRFIAALAILISLAGLASASVVEPRQTTGDCQIGHRILYAPDNVNSNSHYTVKYCTGTYFKTSSSSIILGIKRASREGLEGVVVLAQSNAADGYEFDVSIPAQGNYVLSKNSTWVVFEVINDYYIPHSLAYYSAPLTINDGQSSE